MLPNCFYYFGHVEEDRSSWSDDVPSPDNGAGSVNHFTQTSFPYRFLTKEIIILCRLTPLTPLKCCLSWSFLDPVWEEHWINLSMWESTLTLPTGGTFRLELIIEKNSCNLVITFTLQVEACSRAIFWGRHGILEGYGLVPWLGSKVNCVTQFVSLNLKLQ